MEEAMSHTGNSSIESGQRGERAFPFSHSQYGKDDRVKLPNLTDEEVNWQELEDLYSINESLYECRPDYRPSPDNWANFQKDVDKMFALRHVLNQFNQTRKLNNATLPELGSGAGGGSLEEGSGEELASTSDVWPVLAPDTPLATPDPSRKPPAPSKPEEKLESVVNDLPESLVNRLKESVLSSLGPRKARVIPSDVWVRQLEELEEEMFSGNGPTELEIRHDNLMRTHNSLHAQVDPNQQVLGPSLDPEDEDIFQAQGYLPLSPQTLRPNVQSSTTRSSTITSPTQTSTAHIVVVVLKAPPQSPLPLSLDHEGSGSVTEPSNKTL
ncbi:hypothetical protein CHARACLAT_011993 [Characodon lateralis]|uniref:Uncharacterized protein n=1 Tax=Characodon lateralis TaxID=208331 RepID=A0ABU7EIJ6_9TELE|nr:hypothetical protein [Characodon lateralis]